MIWGLKIKGWRFGVRGGGKLWFIEKKEVGIFFCC